VTIPSDVRSAATHCVSPLGAPPSKAFTNSSDITRAPPRIPPIFGNGGSFTMCRGRRQRSFIGQENVTCHPFALRGTCTLARRRSSSVGHARRGILMGGGSTRAAYVRQWVVRLWFVGVASATTVSLLLFAMPSCRVRTTDDPEPVAECQEYERAFARCTGVDAGISTQPEALAKTEEERQRIRQICSSNLVRLRQTCR
jgi:hypothetical protein